MTSATRSATRSKVTTAREAIGRIRSGSVLVVGGAGGVQEPDLLLSTLVEHFREHAAPRDLVEIHPFRTGESEGRGTSLLGEPGLVATMIGGSFWPIGTPRLIQRILDGEMAAYNLPAGALYAMLEAAAAGRPGVVTAIGLETFADPRQGGGALNAVSRDSYSELITIGGEEYLFYRALRPDVAFIRGTAADPDGNLVMTEEAAVVGALVLAQATRQNRGLVIAQVKQIRGSGELDPREVRVPGILVDAVVEHPGQRQIPSAEFDPSLVTAGELSLTEADVQPLGPAKVVQRRALLECRPGDCLAIGFGLPGKLPSVALEEGVFAELTFTIEHGVIGGLNPFARGTRTFPAGHHPQAIIDAADQVRFYSGGGVDRAFLGVGEIDGQGNVNVSRFGQRISGAGGFVDITQSTRDVVFCCVLGDRGARKFVPRVEQITFNGPRAARRGQRVLYVTEKAVFRLTEDGLVMSEVAPGLDPAGVAAELGCAVRIADDVAPMPERCWSPTAMGLEATWRATTAG